ncbi:hypothetical protein HK100_007306, partial [Physocladia obscura]
MSANNATLETTASCSQELLIGNNSSSQVASFGSGNNSIDDNFSVEPAAPVNSIVHRQTRPRISAAMSPEDRAQMRNSKRAIMISKVSVKIVSFLRLIVLVGDVGLSVTIEKKQTVQDLADLVMAEHMFRKIVEKVGTQDKEKFLVEVENAKPIMITQIYTSGLLALAFDDVLEKVVDFNDTLTVAYLDQVVLG